MFVLMIARGFPTPDNPQWGCFEKDQAEALANLGHKVVVASVDSRFCLRFRKIGITTHQENGVTYYNSFFIPGVFTKLFGRNANYRVKRWQLQRIYNNIEKTHGKPDVIYGQFFFNSFIALQIAQTYNIPLVNIEHAARFNEKNIDKESLFQAQEVYKVSAANIAVSHSLKVSLDSLFNLNCSVVHNMIGNEFSFTPDTVRQSDKVTFVTTGNLIKRKGFDLLPKAFQLAQLPPDKWQMILIGDGSEHKNLQEQIDNAGFHDNILLLGTKNKCEIASILNQSDVFALPSRNENFSVAVLEALACGLPVIASICGGIRECIDNRNGLLFEVDDVQGLAQNIKFMFEHYSNYNRQAIADDCMARFSPKVIAGQLTDIFASVLPKK